MQFCSWLVVSKIVKLISEERVHKSVIEMKPGKLFRTFNI